MKSNFQVNNIKMLQKRKSWAAQIAAKLKIYDTHTHDVYTMCVLVSCHLIEIAILFPFYFRTTFGIR